MAAVTSPSDFGAQENKASHSFHFFPHLFAMKWWDWMTWFSLFECWVLSQLIHSPLSSSLSGSLVPLWFLPLWWCHLHIWGYWYFSQQSWFQLELHPAQHFAWCSLHRSKGSRVTKYSLDILLSLFGTSPLFWTNCCFLTCIQVSQQAGQVVSSLKEFPQFLIHTVKSFSKVNEAEIDVFLEFSCFFYDPTHVGNLISGSSAFSKSSLYIWNFLVHILLKPSLKNFEHYLAKHVK